MAGYGDEISSISLGSIIGGAMCAIVEAQSQAASTTVNFIQEVGFQTGSDGKTREPVYVGFQYGKTVQPDTSDDLSAYTVQILSKGQGYSKEQDLRLTAGGQVLDASITFDRSGALKAVVLNSVPTGLKGTLPIVIQAQNTEASPLPEGEQAASLQLVCALAEERKQITSLKVPLLTMIPIPFIRIDDATIDFNVKINSVQEAKTSSDLTYGGNVEASANYNGFWFKTGIKLNASLSNQKKSSTSDTVKRDYSLNVHVHAMQDDMPAGVERLLDLLSDATSMENHLEEKK